MKHPWLAYIIVGLLSIGAGVAIAGLPDNVPVDPAIVLPATTEPPSPTVPESTVAPATTLAETTVPRSTVPETTEPGTPGTTTGGSTGSNDSVPAERGELTVVAANGANVAGAAVRTATQLEEIGYVDVLPRNGSDIVEFTAIYFTDGFEAAALRLAEDVDLLADFVGPIDEAPSVADIPAETDLLVYIGRDRA